MESLILRVGFVFVNWVSLSIILGLCFGLLFFVLKKYTWETPLNIIILPVLWVVFEYARMWMYAILSFGSESLFSPHFSVGFIGYVLSENQALLQVSRIGGVYMLSGVVMLVNSVLFWAFFKSRFSFRQKISFGAIMAIVIVGTLMVPVTSLLSSSQSYESSRFVNVAVVQTDFSPTSGVGRVERVNIIKELFVEISESKRSVDIIALPEDSRFLITLLKNGEIESFMQGLFGEERVMIIDSSRVRNATGFVRSRVYYHTTVSGDLVTDEKQFLMPHGEYTPYLYRFLLTILGQGEIVDRLDRDRGYTKGNKERIVGTYEGVAVGALFCSEILSPSLYKKLTNENGANILVNLSSQSWFHGSKILYNQTISMAKIHAAQNNRYFVQSGNKSPAFILSNTGEVIVESSGDISSVIYAEIAL